MTPSTFNIGIIYISKWFFKFFTSSYSYSSYGFKSVSINPCIIQEELVSPGWILEVIIITCFSIVLISFGSGFRFSFFVKDLVLFKGGFNFLEGLWASVFISFVLSSSFILKLEWFWDEYWFSLFSYFLGLLVIYKYSTLFPAKEWHRVYLFAFSLVTFLSRY